MFLKMIRKCLGLAPVGFKLVGIYVTDSAGEPMKSVSEVLAIKNAGLEGDRYSTGKGYWHPVEACQVTLISEHDLKLAQRNGSLAFDDGQHRRNLVVSGMKTSHLKGREFSIGDAVFIYEKPRPPCGYLDKIEGKGMAKALSYNSGICVRIVKGADIKVGDELQLRERRQNRYTEDSIRQTT